MKFNTDNFLKEYNVWEEAVYSQLSISGKTYFTLNLEEMIGMFALGKSVRYAIDYINKALKK